jgi:S1-C subfamily serine protease
MGTGFVVGDHQILTAAHVALDAQTVSVQGEGFNGVADVVGLDRDSDSALLYTSERLPQKLAMSSTTPALGAPLALLGFPEAVSDLRVTQGIVSGLDASAEYQDIGFSLEHLVSTDAAINGGNSGGPAFNRDGKVIGLVTGKTVWTANSDPVEGTGYVVPSNQVAPHLRAWLSQRPRSGRPECENGDNAPTDDDLAINVSVVPDTTEARDIARSLVVHGESINNGNYEIAWDLFTARAKRDLGDLETWQSGLGSSYWTDLTVGSAAVRGDDATVEVALGTRQDAADGYHGQTCSVWSLTYTMKRSGAGWLIDHAKNEPGSPKACP